MLRILSIVGKSTFNLAKSINNIIDSFRLKMSDQVLQDLYYKKAGSVAKKSLKKGAKMPSRDLMANKNNELQN